jgi:hypothetical protein
MNQVGLWLVKTQTIGSAVSSVTVTDAFSADFDAYKITITGGVASTAAHLRFNFSGNTAGYYSANTFVFYSGGFVDASSVGNNNAANWARVGYGSTNVLGLNMELLNPFAAQQASFSAMAGEFGTGGASLSTAGWHNNASSFTGFVISPASGTLTGGIIRVYGYRN